MTGGWIKLYRQLLEKPIWQESTPEQKVILITLLSMANHEEREWEWQGEPYKASPGQFVTSLDSIRKKCGKGISLQNVRTALKRFERYGFLTNEPTNKNRLITIVNWEVYQSKDNDLTKELTSNQQATNKQLTTNKNEKNDKNEKNNNYVATRKKRVYADDDPNKKLAILLLKLIRKSQNIKEPDLDKWANTIRLTIESDKRTGREVQDMIVWATSNDFWSGVILSPTSLRKHFDKMAIQKNKRKQQNIYNDELPETGEDW
ncbi:TPA: hypothetical protein I0I20_RS02910 [Enterococcus faecium]